MDFSGQNLNPVVFDTSANRRADIPLELEDDNIRDEVDALEVNFFAFCFTYYPVKPLLAPYSAQGS